MSYTWDIEANSLLDHTSVDYTTSPYKLKPNFSMHCIVIEHHESGAIFAFYDGDTYILDGRGYNESADGFLFVLEAGYPAIEYTHLPLSAFPGWIKQNVHNCKVVAHNGINYDWLVTKLYYGMDYSVAPDVWYGNTVEIIDTLVMSKTLNPDRFGGHSLDNLSTRVGLRKIDFRPHMSKEDKFKHFAADMLYYCIRDVRVNTLVYEYLEKEAGDWDWSRAIELEKSVAEIVTRQEHRGFKFDKELAESNIQKLDEMMEQCRQRVEPLLPPKKATKAYMKDFTPPKRQFKKDGQPSADLIKFATKVGGELVGEVGNYSFVFDGKTFTCPLDTEKPLRDTQIASINDTTHIKEWLVSKFGWSPSEYKEKNLAVRQVKGVGKVTRRN